MSATLEIGGVYQTEWDSRPHRVIGCDEIEVFYDCFWPDINNWGFAENLKQKVFFYRTSASLFKEKSKKINSLPFSSEEFAAFRPDLPMRIARVKELSWDNLPFATENALDNFLQQMLTNNAYSQTINAKEIMIQPSGIKGGLKKAVKVVADNGKVFGISELIWKARVIQNQLFLRASQGIGLYRIGFEKGIPSYYIGEYLDQAGLIKK